MKRLPILIVAAVASAALFLGAGPAFAGSPDQQIADEGIYTSTDIPAEWTSSSPDTADEKANLKRAAKTKGCKEYVKFAVANEKTTNAASDEYELEGQQMSNNSYVHKNVAAASKVMDAIKSSTVPSCLESVFTKAVETAIAKDPEARRQVTGVSMTLQPTEIDSGADDQAAYEGTLSLELRDGSTQETFVGLVAVRLDRVVLTYSLSAPPEATQIADVFGTAFTNTLVRTLEAL